MPLLGFATALWLAAALVIAERSGKAIRSPAKDVMLSHAAAAVGRGRGFAVHEALDQIGALIGPLAVAGVLLLTGDDYGPAFWVLAVPGIAVMILLIRLRTRAPDPQRYETGAAATPATDSGNRARLPAAFWSYLTFTVLTTLGYATFGVLAFHLADRDVVPTATIPVIYAAAMLVDATAALGSGWLYDRIGRRTLLAVPLLSAAVPPLAFDSSPGLAITGALVWGAVLGIQEATMRAAVADLVPTERRATAYGVFAAGLGIATLAGSVLVGALYAISVGATVVAVALIQAGAFLPLVAQVRVARSASSTDPPGITQSAD